MTSSNEDVNDFLNGVKGYQMKEYELADIGEDYEMVTICKDGVEQFKGLVCTRTNEVFYEHKLQKMLDLVRGIQKQYQK